MTKASGDKNKATARPRPRLADYIKAKTARLKSKGDPDNLDRVREEWEAAGYPAIHYPSDRADVGGFVDAMFAHDLRRRALGVRIDLDPVIKYGQRQKRERQHRSAKLVPQFKKAKKTLARLVVEIGGLREVGRQRPENEPNSKVALVAALQRQKAEPLVSPLGEHLRTLENLATAMQTWLESWFANVKGSRGRPKDAPAMEVEAALRNAGFDSDVEIARVLLSEGLEKPTDDPIRRGEAFGLAWSDVDLARRLITIRRSYYGPTKSSRHRTVPIPAELTTILKAWRLSAPWGCDGLVFPDDATGAMVSENATFPQLALRTARARARLRRIRLHDLRHQSVAAFLMAGGSIYDASKNLGHASVAFTAAVYGHLSGDHRVAESDRLSFKIPVDTAAKVIAFEAPAENDRADLSNAQTDS